MIASGARRILGHFAAAIVAPGVFLLAAEGVLRVVGMGEPGVATDSARGFVAGTPVFTERIGDDGARNLELRTPRSAFMARLQFNPQTIPARKSVGEFRILVLGGSLPYGWPYDDRWSFPRALEAGLEAVNPGRPWRVVNMGAPGWGSTRLRLLSEQLVSVNADLVVITSGNNEYLEASFAREVMRFSGSSMRWWLTLKRTSHLLTAMTQVLLPEAQPMREGESRQRLRSLESHSRAQLRTQHRDNLAAMVQRFQRAGSRVYVTTVPVNLRSTPPFGKDAPGELLGPRSPKAVAEYRRAKALVGRSEFSNAATVFEHLLALYPRSARLHFDYAHTLAALGRLDEAREDYLQALELDRLPLRTPPDFNANVERIGASTDAGVVDFVEAMRLESHEGIPGSDLFLDNCHPNRAGIVVLARAVARQMRREGIVRAPEEWEKEFASAAIRRMESARLSVSDRVRGQEFLYYYFTQMSEDQRQATEILQRIRMLDPDHRLVRKVAKTSRQ